MKNSGGEFLAAAAIERKDWSDMKITMLNQEDMKKVFCMKDAIQADKDALSFTRRAKAIFRYVSIWMCPSTRGRACTCPDTPPRRTRWA